MKPSLLFLGKKNDEYCEKALRICGSRFSEVLSFTGDWGDPFPQKAATWRGDFIVSYLSRWIVPRNVLDAAKRAAINFHPASPDYPGIGCTNFALYEGAREYGVTCHHMEEKVDTGQIIAVRRFPVFQTDDVSSLLDRTYIEQFSLFLEILEWIFAGMDLPKSQDKWTRRPFTRSDFNCLNQIAPTMDNHEQARRIRACAYGSYFPATAE